MIKRKLLMMPGLLIMFVAGILVGLAVATAEDTIPAEPVIPDGMICFMEVSLD